MAMAVGKETVGRAPGKLILMGEHFVVYGAPALAVPVGSLELEARANLIPKPPTSGGSGDGGQTDGEAASEGTRNKKDHLAACLELACHAFSMDPDMVHLEVRSDIPIGAGLGSSAALSVAVAFAVGRLAGRGGDPSLRRIVRDVSMEAERLAHGRPSGVDTEVCLTRKPLLFSRESGVRNLSIQSTGAVGMIVMESGPGASTARMVSLAADYVAGHPDRFKVLDDESRLDVEDAARALVQGNTERLGELMLRQHKRLQEIGVSNWKLDTTVQKAMEAGAS
ncbi:MAG: mevalonate kinase, partial [Deltaproteobacteria bacterium]|nr:mevalonate kinase [Deltaproteobacteria bacterium]